MVAGSVGRREAVQTRLVVEERACRRDGVVVGGRGNSVVGVLVHHIARVGVRGEEALVQVRSDRRLCSGCRAVLRLATVARLGRAVVRTGGGTPGVAVAGVHMWPLVSSWLRVRAGRSCWIQGTFP